MHGDGGFLMVIENIRATVPVVPDEPPDDYNTYVSIQGETSNELREESPPASKRLIKLTVNLSPEVYDALKALAARRGLTVTEALRQAISTAKWVQDTLDHGEKILKQDPRGNLFEIVFR
jgi:predicted transcriptional regulator